VVYVIHLPNVRIHQAHDFPMDGNIHISSSAPIRPGGVKHLPPWAKTSMPLPLREPFKIGFINECNFALSQRNFAVR
jgi:hypothetical protein